MNRLAKSRTAVAITLWIALGLGLAAGCGEDASETEAGRDPAAVIDAFCDAVCVCDSEDCFPQAHQGCIDFLHERRRVADEDGCLGELDALLVCGVDNAVCDADEIVEARLVCPLEYDAHHECERIAACPTEDDGVCDWPGREGTGLCEMAMTDMADCM